MRFLVDAQLPPALATVACRQGHEAEHVGDRQMQAASDAEIWDYRAQAGRGRSSRKMRISPSAKC